MLGCEMFYWELAALEYNHVLLAALTRENLIMTLTVTLYQTGSHTRWSGRRAGEAIEEKRSVHLHVLPSRSFHKAGYLVDTPPKGHWQWITGQRASQRVQVSG